MKEKFTPAPWKFDSWGRVYSTDEHRNLIAKIHCKVWNSESKANAHLIAAAPKMYAMLSFLLTELKGIEETIAWDDVEEILAEARGEL